MKKRFISWAQELEDLILYDALHEVKEGFYIDVGANHPWEISVTKAFYDIGWHGVNIEPLEKEYTLLCKCRPNDLNLNVGCGNRNDTLYLYGEGCGAFFDETLGGATTSHAVQVKTLTDICNENCSKGQVIHFLKIDVEGFEKEVLEGIDFLEWHPWVFCIESTLPGGYTPSYDRWEHILFENGYKLGTTYGINRYYVASDLQTHIEFKSMAELEAEYEILSINDLLVPPAVLLREGCGTGEVMKCLGKTLGMLPRALFGTIKRHVMRK